MESVTRNVRDINSRERKVLEQVLGRPLTDDQRVVLRVEAAQPPVTPPDVPTAKLPEWCDVYAGLTDEEIAEIEAIALSRADLTRTFE